MNKSKDFIKNFIKKEPVLIISMLLAIATMLLVKPGKEYLGYIDFRTLALLFCLMTVMAGFNGLGLFKALAEMLLSKAKSLKGLILLLVVLCFFFSMVITNDVALITFVPFTIITLSLAGKKDKLIFTVVLETIGANLGSMLTPIGNPQNLYLFNFFNMDILSFEKALLPYGVLSLLLLVTACLFSGKGDIKTEKGEKIKANKKQLILYTLLFILSLLCVFKVITYPVLLAILLVSLLIFDRRILLKADYSLLLTFVFLFVFIGNLGQIPSVNSFLTGAVKGNEVVVGVLASQAFSNVPAAILLSKFTGNAYPLLLGVNLGGLGTLIASMASLISFKFVQKENVKTGSYLLIFTVANIIILLLKLALWYVIKQI